ncbi:MAG: PAS domain S-box protein [Anaerolineae bacterium]|nr:PAS domain S-box protein [Anaerolineae bacterium]
MPTLASIIRERLDDLTEACAKELAQPDRLDVARGALAWVADSLESGAAASVDAIPATVQTFDALETVLQPLAPTVEDVALLYRALRAGAVEAARRASEAKLAGLIEGAARSRVFFERSANAILMLEGGRFVEMNQAALAMLGADSKAQVIDRSLDTFSPECQPDGQRSPEKAQAMIQAALEQGTHRFEWVCRRLDGEEFWAEVTLTAVEVEGRPILHMVWCDITEHKRAEQRLKDSEDEFRTLYEATGDAVMLLDGEGFFACNPATLRVFGCERYDQFIGKHPSAFSPQYQPGGEDSLSLAAERINTALEEGQCLFEWRHSRLDGTEFPAEVLLTAMTLRGRRVVQAVVRDITGRVQAEAALREANAQFRATLSTLPDLLFEMDCEGRFRQTYATDPGRLLAPPESFLGKTVTEVMPPSAAETIMAAIARAIDTKRDTGAVYSLEGPGGAEWYELSIAMKEAPDDSDIRFIILIRDVTERVQARQEIDEQREFLRQVIDSSPYFIFVRDREGRFLLANQALASAYGTTSAEITGKTDADFRPDAGFLARIAQEDREVMETRQVRVVPEELITYPDGKTRWMQTVKRPLIDADGVARRVLGLSVDITDRKELELAQVRRAQLYGQFSNLLVRLLSPMPLTAKLGKVTDWIVEQMGVAFCRIWTVQREDGQKFLYLQAGSGQEQPDEGELGRIPLGVSIIGEIAAGSEARFLTNDLSDPAHEEDFAWARALGLESFAGYKLNTPDGEVLGVFALFGKQPFAPEDDAFLESMAGATSLVIRTAVLEEESTRLAKAREEDLQRLAQRRAVQVRISTEVAQEIAAATDIATLYERVVTLVKERFNYYHAQIFRYEPAQNAMVLMTGYGEPGARMLARHHRVEIGTGIVGTSLATGGPVLASDVREDPYWIPNPDLPETRGELAVPIKWRGEVLGILDVQSNVAGALTQEDWVLLEGLCGQIAIAINAMRLLEEANIFRQFAEASGQGLGMADLEGSFIYVNPTLTRFLGAESADRLIGEKVYSFFPEDVARSVRGEIMTIVREQGQWSGELPCVALDGSVLDTIQNIFTIYDERGQPQYLANAITDITARKQAEESFRLFRRLADASGQGLGMATLEGIIIYANPTLSGLLDETSPDAMLNKPLGDYYPDALRRRLPTEILPTVMAEGQWTGELALVSRTGRIIPTIENFFLIRDEDNNPLYLADIVTDITAQKDAEAEMEERLRELDALYRAMSQEGWQSYREVKTLPPGYLFEHRELKSAEGLWLPEMEQATRQNALVAPGVEGGNGATVAPLSLRGGEVIGALGVYNDPLNPLSSEDLALIREVSDQVAQALEAARLFEQTQISLAETDLLYRTSRIIGNAQTIETILEGAAELATFMQMGYVGLHVFTRRSADGTPALMDVYSLRLGGETQSVRRFEGIAFDDEMRVMLLASSLDDLILYVDIENLDIEMPSRIRANLRASGNRGGVSARLSARGQVTGILTFASVAPLDEFSERDKRLVTTVADQASVALDNIQLLRQTEASLEETAALYRTSSALASATDTDSVLAAMLDYAQAPAFDRALVLIIENLDAHPSEWVIEVRAMWDRAGDEAAHLGNRFTSMPVPSGAASSAPLVADDLDDPDAGIDDAMRAIFRQMDVRSAAMVPIATGGRVFGWLLVGTIDRVHKFEEREVQNFRTVAEQAAVVLDNQRLITYSTRRAEEMGFLFRVTQAATSGGAEDLEAALGGVVEVIDDFLQAYEIDILVPVPNEKALRRMVCTHDTDVGQLVPYRGTSVGWVARHVEPLIIEDMASDRRFNDFAEETRSALVIPIAAGRELSGVLQIQSLRRGGYDDQVLRLLQTMSNSLHAVIQNIQLLRDVQEANARLGELNRLKSEFLASTSHELRTPLNSIIGFSRVLLKEIDGPLNNLQRTDLQTIHNSGQHLLTLINDILDQSKIEAGQMELSFEYFDIASVIHEVISTVSVQVSEKPVELVEQVGEGLPQVWGDEFRTRQILINLVNNAIKFTEIGSVTVAADLKTEISGRKIIHVAVTDTGIGIAPEDHYKLFEAFRQVDNTTTRKYGGTGLGLPITKALVELQGGKIWVESELGKGSTFIFSISLEPPEVEGEAEDAPAKEAEVKGPITISFDEEEPGSTEVKGPIAISFGDEEDEGRRGERAGKEEPAEGPAAISFDDFKEGEPESSRLSGLIAISFDRKPRESGEIKLEPKVVLALDDEWGVINMYRRYLVGGGYEVLGTTNPESLKQMVLDFKPSVVLLDVVLPESDINGWDVLRELKADPRTAGVPVIVCTIVDEPERGYEMGAAKYLVKPFLEDELVQAVQALEGRAIAVPVVEVQDEAPAPEPEDVPPEAPLQPKVVMVLDDQWDTINLYRRYLVGGGYEVLGTTSPENLINMVKQFRPFVVLLDVVIPDSELDGVDVLEQLKADPETQDIPVVMCSVTKDTERTLEAGAAAHLIKPFAEADLVTVVRQIDHGQLDELSVAGDAAPVETVERAESVEAVEAVEPVEPAPPKMIIALDDEWEVINLYRRYLLGAGYEVLGTASPDNMLNMVKQFKPVIVLLDLVFPAHDIDGWAILEQLKAEPATQDIPVIICTILDEEKRAQASGAAGFLVKPFLEEQLIKAVSEVERRAAAAEDVEVGIDTEPALPSVAARLARSDRPKVVIALDDEWDTINLYRRYLLGGGYEVLGTTSPDNLVNMVKQFKPIVVLLDVVIPGSEMDGWDVLRQLKEDSETQDTPVMVCTILDEAERGLAMGATRVLTKPFSEQDLVQAVRRVELDLLRKKDA